MPGSLSWDVSEEGLASTTDQAREDGHNVSGEHVDVTDEAAVRAAMARIVESHGRLDTVFINAGIAGRAKSDRRIHAWLTGEACTTSISMVRF